MKFVGPVDVRSLNTPSGRVILSPPFLSEFRLIKKWSKIYMMKCGPPRTTVDHSFHPPMVATSAGLAPLRRSGLTLLLSRVGSMRLWFFIFSRICGRVSDAVLSQALQARTLWEQGQVLGAAESVPVHGCSWRDKLSNHCSGYYSRGYAQG